MISRRDSLRLAASAGFAVLALLLAGLRPVAAGGPAPFDEAAFSAAQAAGKPILVEIAAPWCPACLAQKPILARLAAEPRFAELQIFTIDFDTQKALMRRFKATLQSTLIAYKGEGEVGRSIGETQAEWIEALLDKTL